jgi:hypothetical protein
MAPRPFLPILDLGHAHRFPDRPTLRPKRIPQTR